MEIIPTLTDLVRDWIHDRQELHGIIIHKVADHRTNATGVVGRILLGTWIAGYVEDTFVEFAANTKFRIIYAADPEFFDKLYEDFLQIIEIAITKV